MSTVKSESVFLTVGEYEDDGLARRIDERITAADDRDVITVIVTPLITSTGGGSRTRGVIVTVVWQEANG